MSSEVEAFPAGIPAAGAYPGSIRALKRVSACRRGQADPAAFVFLLSLLCKCSFWEEGPSHCVLSLCQHQSNASANNCCAQRLSSVSEPAFFR